MISPQNPLTVNYKDGLALDFFPVDRPARAIVVYLHGGSFMSGSRNDRLARHFSTLLKPREIVFVSVDYRKGGRPLVALPSDLKPIVEAATNSSLDWFPEVPSRLFGPLLYRAVIDLTSAIKFIRNGGLDPAHSRLPLVLMGLSAGGIAAMSLATGIDGLPNTGVLPDLVLGVSSILPQPWRLTPTSAQIRLLVSKGDEVIPRSAVERLDLHARAAGLPLSVTMIPYGRHNRPVRELISGQRPDGSPWSNWITEQIEAVALPTFA